jgi:hypothetical protein
MVHPTNDPSRDSTRLQAEAVFSRRAKKRTLFHTGDKGDPTFKVDRSTKQQADALFEDRDPSQPVAAPTVDTSKDVVRESDLGKHPAVLIAERNAALQRGDEMRAAELQRAMGVQQNGRAYAERMTIVEDRVEDTEPGYSPANTRGR